MRRFLPTLLLLGLLAPSLGFASSSPSESPPDDLLPTFFLTDDAGLLLAISPLTQDIFVWSLWQASDSFFIVGSVAQQEREVLSYLI